MVLLVPQTMLLKLQPSTGTRLPPYNPLLPPPAISQVLLLANPEKVSVEIVLQRIDNNRRRSCKNTRAARSRREKKFDEKETSK